MFLFLILITLKKYSSLTEKDKLIISLTANKANINSIYKVINSILDQNINKTLYKILLIFSKKEIKGQLNLSKKILFFVNINKIRIVFMKNRLNLQTRLIFAMKLFPLNPIIIVNSKTSLPEGWLEMFFKDHKNYPNDIICSSIQYYFGKNLTINEFSEGYKGKYFGRFNHISNMIFNFAIINSDLGGTLFPPGIFKSKLFFNNSLFLKISKESDDIWQSCFIIMEDKTMRQS